MEAHHYFFLLVAGCLFLILLSFDFNLEYSSQIMRRTSKNKMINNVSESAQCTFYDTNPWDDEILEKYKPQTYQAKVCPKDTEYLTKLEGGKFIQLKSNYFCWGRCLYRNTEQENKVGPWFSTRNTNTIFSCDIVESYCSVKDDLQTASHAALHSQIVETKGKSLSTEMSAQETNTSSIYYNVYMIILNSTSTNQAIRNFPKMLRYLDKSMKAVSFPYINSLGTDSKANAWPLFFGKQFEFITKTENGSTTNSSHFSSCNKHLDDEPFLLKEFAAKGYKTMMADDWINGAFHEPNCKSFEKQPADHYFRPFINALYTHDPNSSVAMNINNCLEHYKHPLDYLERFMNSYVGIPKMSYVWLTDTAKGDFNIGLEADTALLEFFIKNRKQLDQGFVLVLSDSGFSGDEISNTKVGHLEMNNPMLQIALPKEQRKNEGLVNMLRKNSEKLHTHFDTRATLLDILKFQPSSHFSDQSILRISGEKGQSYLREIEETRNCHTLSIPTKYCICKGSKRKENRH